LISDNLDGVHTTQCTNITDAANGVLIRHCLESAVDMGAQFQALFKQALLFDDVKNGERRLASDRIATEGAAKAAWWNAINDIGAANNAR
jgi:hypothetical protein